MTMNDPIGDMISRIRNAAIAGVEAGTARLCVGAKPAAHQQRSRRRDPVDAERRDG